MRPMMTAFFLSTLLWMPSVFAETTGAALLRAFQCEGIGSETSAIRNSIGNLKDMMKSLGDADGPCGDVKSTISKLPSIDDLMVRLEEDSELRRLNELEATINEALANMDYIRNIPASERHLYPDESDLKHIVVTSRSQLLHLRANLSISESRLRKQNQIRGVAELDRLGGRLADAISNHPECFEGKSELKRHSLTALVGISGYFMSEPVGVATTAAARNLQNLFRIFGGRNTKFMRSVEPIIKAEMGLGFGCALESLANQHCNLIRQKGLLSRMGSQHQCKEGDESCTEAAVCEDCELKSLQMSNAAKSHMRSITEWVALRDKVGDSTNPEVAKARTVARQAISEVADDLVEDISQKINSSKAISSKVQKEKLFYGTAMDGLQRLSDLIIKGDQKASGTYNDDKLNSFERLQVQGESTEEETYFKSLQIVMGSPDEGADLYRSLLDKYNEKRETENRYGGKASKVSRVLDVDLLKSMQDVDIAKPTMAEFRAQISSKEGLEKMASSIKAFKSDSLRRLQTGSSDQRKRDLATRFFAGTPENKFRSVYDSLKGISTYLDFAKDQLGNTNEGKFSNIKGLQKRINNVLFVADSIVAMPNPVQEDVAVLTGQMNKLLGANQEFLEEISTLATNVTNLESKRLSEVGQNILFDHSQGIVKDALNIATDADLFSKTQDVHAALELSERQIKAFSKFFEGESKEIKKLLDSTKEDSLSSYNINQLCFQILGMKNPKAFKEICKGKKIVAPDGRERSFNSLVDSPLEERACALPLFRNSMK